MRKLLVFFSALITLNGLSAGAWQNTALNPGGTSSQTLTEHLVEIPIYQVNNRNVILVEGASRWLNLVLDTGATKSALFQSENYEFEYLEKLGSSEILFPALDEKVTGHVLAPLTITHEDFSFTINEPLLISSRPPIGDRLNFAFDGVLGQDFFNSFVVEINPDKQHLRLYPVGHNVGEAFSEEIPLTLLDQAPYIRFSGPMPWERKKNNIKNMLLDTGYPGLMVFWSEEHFHIAAGERRASELIASNTGIFTKANFKIGSVRFLQAPVFLAPRVPQQIQQRDGIIGANVMNAHHHVIDFGGGALYLNQRSIKFSHTDGAFYVPNNEAYIYRRFNNDRIGMKHSMENKLQ